MPLVLDIEGRTVIIFGGGPVGERKAAFFTGAKVTVVSPRFTPGLEEMARKGLVTLIQKAAIKEDIASLVKGAFIVVAATDDGRLNDDIIETASTMGALANAATGSGDVIVPSMIRKGEVVIGISTGGMSPGMSKYMRKKVEGVIGPEMDAMVRLQGALREQLKAAVPDQKERERLVRDMLDDPAIWETLAVSYDDALALAMKKLR